MIYYNEDLMAGYLSKKRPQEEERSQRLWRVSGLFEVGNARSYMQNAWMCDGGNMGVSGQYIPFNRVLA